MGDAASKLLFWVDLEMTGLEPDTCSIVEIASLVTDSQLEIVAQGPELVIHQPDDVLASMNDFVRQLHTRSGLVERIRSSTVSLDDAAAQTLAFIEANLEKGTAPLCGNSVWKDRSFLERYMPSVLGHLHYRIVDVSTIKELVRRWYPQELQVPRKREVHRALDDIRESIEELKWYRSKVFVPLPTP